MNRVCSHRISSICMSYIGFMTFWTFGLLCLVFGPTLLIVFSLPAVAPRSWRNGAVELWMTELWSSHIGAGAVQSHLLILPGHRSRLVPSSHLSQPPNPYWFPSRPALGRHSVIIGCHWSEVAAKQVIWLSLGIFNTLEMRLLSF